MSDTNQNRTAGGNHGNDPLDNPFDRELDAALAKYSAVEPRSGLERRVLANLQAERARVPDRMWWSWAIAGAITIAFVLAVAAGWESRKFSRPTIAHLPVVTTAAPKPCAEIGSGTQATHRDLSTEAPRTHVAIRRTRTDSAHRMLAIAPGPKLNQFPSPRPLSEQEEILQNYVAKDPERAVLLARALTDALNREYLEQMNLFLPGNSTPVSNER